MVSFILLTRETRAHKVSDKATVMVDHELLTKALQRLLCTFMTSTVRQLENSWENRGLVWDKHTVGAHDQTISETPGLAPVGHNGVAQRTKVIIQLQFAA